MAFNPASIWNPHHDKNLYEKTSEAEGIIGEKKPGRGLFEYSSRNHMENVV